jgi:flagellar biosynthesis/type III secretory pathway protein FliH
MSECHCRVLLHEVVPILATEAATQKWLADRKVKVLYDWQGRPCVDVPTAKRLHDEATAAQQDADREFAERQAAEKAEREAAEQRVRAAYRAAYDKAKARGKSNGEASYAGHEAAEAAREGRTGGFRGVFS